MSKLFKGFENDDEINFEKIVLNLLEPDNIELKTEVNDPLAVSAIKAISTALKESGWLKSYETLENWLQYYLKIMVSNKRKGRQEVSYIMADIVKNIKKGLSFLLSKSNEGE